MIANHIEIEQRKAF